MNEFAVAAPRVLRVDNATLTFVTSTEHPRWKIVGSPAIVQMAARLFSGSIMRSADTVSFPAVQVGFDDLLMLRERFALTIACKEEWAAFERARAESLAWLEASDEAVVNAERFHGTLLAFQKAGVRFMLAARCGILADDMGLGKTVQALALLAKVDRWPALIVCQPHMVSHWAAKTQEFLHLAEREIPLTRRRQRRGYAIVRGRCNNRLPPADILICHYLSLHNWAKTLAAAKPSVLMFDECQELRHPGTRKHDAAKTVADACDMAFGLSGTPIYNRGGEIFEVLNVINRNCLGTRNDFQREWCEYGDVVSDPVSLGQYLRDRRLMLRRRKDEVLTELPPKRRSIEKIDADNELFAELLKSAVAKAKQAEMIANPFDRGRMEAEAIAQTRKATAIAKAPAVVAFLNGLLDAGESVLCFAHHHAVHDHIESALSHFRPARITGRESMSQKDEAKFRFIRGETDLLLISLRAATGIDGLQKRAKCVVFAELDWSPAVHRQAEDRAHRMGQRDSVLAYYLVADIGTDPDIMETLALKESQFMGLMHEEGESDEERAHAAHATRVHMHKVLERLRAA